MQKRAVSANGGERILDHLVSPKPVFQEFNRNPILM